MQHMWTCRFSSRGWEMGVDFRHGASGFRFSHQTRAAQTPTVIKRMRLKGSKQLIHISLLVKRFYSGWILDHLHWIWSLVQTVLRQIVTRLGNKNWWIVKSIEWRSPPRVCWSCAPCFTTSPAQLCPLKGIQLSAKTRYVKGFPGVENT